MSLIGSYFLIYFQEFKPLRKQNSNTFSIGLRPRSTNRINRLILTVVRRVGGPADGGDASNAISVEVEMKECVEGMNASIVLIITLQTQNCFHTRSIIAYLFF